MNWEIIKHMLGLCGEPHPSLLMMLSFGGIILYYFKHSIKFCYKKGCNICKKVINKL